MLFNNLSEVFDYQQNCPLCNHIMPLYCVPRFIQESSNILNIENNKCFLYIVRAYAESLVLDIYNNTYHLENILSPIKNDTKTVILNGRKISFNRKCLHCSGKFKFQTAPLNFTVNSDKFNKPQLTKLEFDLLESEDNLIRVVNDYEHNETSLLKITYKKNPYVAKHYAPIVIPLTEFNFTNQEKLLNKIKTLITLS